MRNSNIPKTASEVTLATRVSGFHYRPCAAFSANARAGSFSINDVSGNYVELAKAWAFGNGVVNFDPISQVGLRHVYARDRNLHEI